MRVLVLGCDGYIGWALTNHLLQRDYYVAGVDDGSRRRRVKEIGSDSLIPISSRNERKGLLRVRYKDRFLDLIDISLGVDGPGYIQSVLTAVRPDTIIHLAEQPSAPWSMRSVHEASATQMDNVIGTLHLLWAINQVCPEAHLVKLGTMGEYGTPACDIPEGRIPLKCLGGFGPPTDIENYECPMSDLLFPRTAGSFYHLSKVHDTHNIEFACRNWGLCSTDIMQGVVFGNEYDTRFDYDQYFGTVINRFCVQAIIEHPLTVYGRGFQTRGFLPLKDSLQCIEIAINNPPKSGEYRTFNQFENIYTLNRLASIVVKVAKSMDLNTDIYHMENPRYEAEEHYYNPIHEKLLHLGYIPTTDIEGEIHRLISILLPYKSKVISSVIMPTTGWR